MVPLALLLPGATTALAQNFPTKPIRMVASQAGGGVDFAARIIAQGLAPLLGQPVIVDNRPGEIIPGDTVARAAPDGYTILMNGSSMLFVIFMRNKVPFHPLKSFAPVTLAHKSPNVLVVASGLPVKSVRDLIALAKAKPGEIDYASAGLGSSTHLAAQLFKSMAGIDTMHIPYKGSSPALTALIGGQVSYFFATPSSAGPHVKSGRLRALAVTTAQPSALFPGLPTVASSGLSGYEAASTNGVLAPAGTPPAIINRLNQAIVQVLNQPEAREKFFNSGSEVIASSPQEFAATIRSELEKWGRVIKEAGIKPD